MKSKTDLLVERIKFFEDQKMRDEAWERMSKNIKKSTTDLIKKALTRIGKNSYIGGNYNV